MKTYDLAIIGAGPGGYVAALYASRAGIRTAVIEKDVAGGTCLNRGCIPTKAMLQSAAYMRAVAEAPAFGIITAAPSVDFSAVTKRRDDIVSRLRTGVETLFRANHIDYLAGTARFIDAHTLVINNADRITATSIIVATGSRVASLPGIPIDEERICSSDGILRLTALPRRLVIVGGGVIGCEFASLFNAFGCQVTIVELCDRILPQQPREIAKKMETIFKRRGITILTSATISTATRNDQEAILTLADGRSISADVALVSVGRTPNTDTLGIEAIGIESNRGRIIVDNTLRTRIPSVYAIGDCIGGPLLAHKASHEGILACEAILGRPRPVDYTVIPSCIYTDPEVATVGLSEDEARGKLGEITVAKFPYLASGKATIMGKPEGFIKLIASRTGKLVGAELFGAEACTLIGEATLALTTGSSLETIAFTPHAHPTLPEIFQEAAHIATGHAIHSL